MQDRSISIANTLEILQYCTKPWIGCLRESWWCTTPLCHCHRQVVLPTVAALYDLRMIEPYHKLWCTYCFIIVSAALIVWSILYQGGCAIQDIRPKLILNSNLVKTCLSITYCSVAQLFHNFAHSTAVILPCYVQIFKTIGQRQNKLWTN